MGMCKKCGNMMGWLILIAGLLYLLTDLNVWRFPLEWYTVAFLIWGLSKVGKSHCKDCQSCCAMPKKGKK